MSETGLPGSGYSVVASLLQVIIQTANAQKASLLTLEGNFLCLDLEMTVSVNAAGLTQFSLSSPLSIQEAIPLSVITFVEQHLKTVAWVNTGVPPEFRADPYWQHSQPATVLCMPVLHQGTLIALLYLENGSALNSDRAEIIHLLCVQAATSLMGSHLHSSLLKTDMFYEHLANNIPGVVYQLRISPTGEKQIRYINPGCYEVLEVSPQEVLQDIQVFLNLIHWEDKGEFSQFLSFSKTAQEAPRRWTGRIVTPIGGVKWVQGVSRPEVISDGSILWHGMLMDITQSKQLERELLLTRITSRIRQSLNLSEILRQTVKELLEVLQCDRVLIYCLQEDGCGTINAESHTPGWKSLLGHRFDQEVFPPTCHAYYAKGKVGMINQKNIDSFPPCLGDLNRKNQVKSLLAVPILQLHRLWGLLLIHQCSTDRDWSCWEIELLQQVSESLSIAVLQATLFNQVQLELQKRIRYEAELQIQARSDRLLSLIATSINQTLSLSEVLDTCLDHIRTFLGCDRVIIYRFHQDWTGTIERESLSIPTLSVSGRMIDDPCFRNLLESNFHRGSDYFSVIDDVESINIMSCHREMLKQFDVRANIVVGIRQNDQLWGLLITHQCNAPHIWHPLEISTLKQVAIQVGTAVQKEQFYSAQDLELKERKRIGNLLEEKLLQEQVFASLSQKIRWSFDLEEIFASTVSELLQYLDCDRVLILQILPNCQQKIVAERATRGPEVINQLEFQDIIPEEVCRLYWEGNARIINIPSYKGWKSSLVKFLEEQGARWLVCTPILQYDANEVENSLTHLWGLIKAFRNYDREWTKAEVYLMEQTAAQVGIAIQKASLYLQNKAELKQREILLKEIHHRVKNNLQIMSSLLRMQFDEDNPLIAEYQSRIQAMALVHDQLYRSENLDSIEMQSYINYLVEGLFNTYTYDDHNIEFILEAHTVVLSLEQAIPVGLILNELISNALKYAFPNREGKLTVVLRKEKECIQLSVTDNGVGIPSNMDIYHTDTLGMQIIIDLTTQLGGSLQLWRSQGTTFEISIPYSNLSS